jgi:glycogen debranching enzyme
VWVNVNWGAVQGFRRHGLLEEARALTRQTLELVDRNGFWEYYDPDTGTGLGSEKFSWTAALVLDLLGTQLSL